MAAAAILDNFEWPYLRSGSRSTYIVHRAVIFETAQLSCIEFCLGQRAERKLVFHDDSRETRFCSRDLDV